MTFKKENVIWHQNENSQMSLTDSLTVFEVGGKLFLTTFFFSFSASKALDLSETAAKKIKMR